MVAISQYFSREEFACQCGCGFATVDVELINVLESVREYFDSPIKINSGCRCAAHNFDVGGVKGSRHKLGIAADIVVKDVSPETVYAYIDSTFPSSYGVGSYQTFTHIDVRGHRARW
jgi:uncharacterized protein YcbK (DUF882 family)